jgi:hypothetical protein
MEEMRGVTAKSSVSVEPRHNYDGDKKCPLTYV